jgi:hypothetical protein
MSETTQSIFANSFQIAWDYLEATGELGNPDRAAQYLLDTIRGHDPARRKAAASFGQ